jgi:hypothetical protein
MTFQLLQADSRHGPRKGKVHLCIGGKTLCGRNVADFPGTLTTGDEDALTCNGCIRKLEYDRRSEYDQTEFFRWYDEYLESPEWDERRSRVLSRARGVCEGCRKEPATQVHHLTYERVGREMLFDLAAVCRDCHDCIHGHEDASVIYLRAFRGRTASGLY